MTILKSVGLSVKVKGQSVKTLQRMKTFVENHMGRRVTCLRSGNGLEYCNKQFESFYRSNGILRHRTVKMTPQQNGLA